MRRFLLALVMLLLVVAIPAAAQDDAPTLDQVTGLARYYPASSPLFLSFRVDDAYIQTWSDLIERLNQQLDLGLDGTLVEELDRGLMRGSGGDFDEMIRSWLGGTVAFGITNLVDLTDDKPENDSLTPWLIALDVTNRDEATAVWRQLLQFGDYTVEETDAYTLFDPVPRPYYGSEPLVMITDDALFIASVSGALPVVGAPALDQEPQFSENLAQLPEPTYNGVMFLNFAALYPVMLQSSMSGLTGASAQSMDQLMDMVSGLTSVQVYGFTILDDDSLVMDAVQPLPDADALAAAGYPDIDYSTYGVVDPEFVQYVPSGTTLVFQMSNLRRYIEDAERSFAAAVELQMQMIEGTGISPEEVERQLRQMEMAGEFLEGLTGLDLRDDVISWMDGDFVLALSLNPAFAEAVAGETMRTFPFPVEFAMIVDAESNPEAAAAAVAGLGDVAENFLGETGDVTVTQETIGGGEAWVITVDDSMVEPFDIVIGSDEHVFVIGTREMARHALAPDGGLNTDAAYQAAQAYVPDNAVLAAYILGDSFPTIREMFESTMMDYELQQLDLIFALFGQSSMSAWYSDEAAYMRGVLTLPGE